MKDWINKMIEREAIPKPLRTDTIEKFCKENGIAIPTYHYQKYKKENQSQILEITLNKARSECPEILDVLIEKAKTGDMKAIDTYLDSVVKLAKHLDLKTDGKPIGLLNLIQDGLRTNNSNGEDKETQQEN